jgi:hypothetical protein
VAVISEVDESGLVSIKIKESVYQVNDGASIDPGLLSVEFLKKSEESVLMTKWELISYS